METVEKRSFKESVLEVLAIIEACLTCFWFWVPTMFAIYLYVELYMMTINPLLLLIGPAIMIAYALLWEERRIKAQYGIKDVKVLRSSDPIFTMPRRAPSKVEIEQLVEEYKKLVKKRAEKSGKTGENDEQ